MKADKTFERNDLEIDRDIQLSEDNPQVIVAYVELWCNVKEKFNVEIGEGATMDMYAFFNPFEDSLQLKCVIKPNLDTDEYWTIDYNGKPEDKELIKQLITEKIAQEYDVTPQEFCNEYIQDDTQDLGGQQ